MQVIVDKFTFPGEFPVGQYAAHTGEDAFNAWCAETVQYLQFGEPIDYQAIDGASAWGPAISGQIDQLMSWADAAGWPTDPKQSEAVQRDIWSILGGGQGVIDTADAPLTQHASQLHHLTRQDLLIVSAIDEPDPAPLLLIALLLLSAFRIVHRLERP